MAYDSTTYQNLYKNDDWKRREHMAVRKTAGWYLWTHQLLEVTGIDAADFLDHIFPNNIANLKVGRERYTTMLDDKGEIIDDVVVFRVKEDTFWISTLFIFYLTDWLDQHKEGYQVVYRNITETQHMFAVQGPKALEMVNAIVDKPVDDLKFFSFEKNTVNGEIVLVNRAGFTGEKYGYEIYIAAEKIGLLRGALEKVSPEFGAREVTDFQIMAWTLPTEAGYYYMRDLRHCNPLEVGLDRGINWEKNFIGKEALLKVRESGPAREMVGFTTDAVNARINARDHGDAGNPVILRGGEIGRVYKYNYSYVQEKPVGYMLVKAGSVKEGDHVLIKGRYDAVITQKSFL